MQINKTIYVENEERLIYKVAALELRADGWLNVELEFVCGFDYINADESNAQGYVDKENFIDEVEHEFISCDLMNESLIQALEYHDYKVIEQLPQIHNKGDK